MQPAQAAADAAADPFRGVVEGRAGDAADLREDFVGMAGEVGADGIGGQGAAEEVLGGAVVGGCIEGADAAGEGAVDEGCCWEGVGVRVVLGVEGCGAHY